MVDYGIGNVFGSGGYWLHNNISKEFVFNVFLDCVLPAVIDGHFEGPLSFRRPVELFPETISSIVDFLNVSEFSYRFFGGLFG